MPNKAVGLRGAKALDRYVFDVLSVDIFDTLLLRCHRSEQGRFHEIAKIQSRRLKSAGFDVTPKHLLISRIEVHNLVYRGLELYRPQGDVQFSRISQIQCDLLGLEERANEVLLSSEIEFETQSLRPNRALLGEMELIRESGKRVVAASDTHFDADTLTGIITSVVGSNPFDHVYTSAGERATKHSGALFPLIAKHEGVDPSLILHCGDNYRSDHVMAERNGLQALLRRRPIGTRIRRKLPGFLGYGASRALS